MTVAQAFHWFDGPRALAEIHRVLRPGGMLAVIFNRRRMEDEIHRAIQALLAPYRGDTPAHASDAWRAAARCTPTSSSPPTGRRSTTRSRSTATASSDRFGSVSFVAALDAEPRAKLLASLSALAQGGPVALRYRTEIDVLRARR